MTEIVRRVRPAMRWWSMAERVGKQFNVAPHVIVAVIAKESAGDDTALGDNGTAIGLMQVRPIAFKDVQLAFPGTFAGVSHSSLKGNAELQIKAGAAFLRLMMDRTGDFLDALDAYNQGERAAEASPGVSSYALDVTSYSAVSWLWKSFSAGTA